MILRIDAITNAVGITINTIVGKSIRKVLNNKNPAEEKIMEKLLVRSDVCREVITSSSLSSWTQVLPGIL